MWSRLLQDLLEAVLEFSVGDGGIMVLRCKGRFVEEAVTERYLHDSAARLAISNKLADYFSGKVAEEAVKSESPLSPGEYCSTAHLPYTPLLNW